MPATAHDPTRRPRLALRGRRLGLGATLIAFLIAVLAAACTRSLGRGPDAPAGLEVGDSRFAGTWVSRRTSQLGLSAMRIRFQCSGEYQVRARIFAGAVRLHESGEFWTTGSTLHLTRAAGEVTRWSFRLEDDVLRLEEAPGEWHVYRRAKEVPCRDAAQR